MATLTARDPAAALRGAHIEAASQFTRPVLEDLFRVAAALEALDDAGAAVAPLAGCVMAPLFFEASSRTFSSFVAAMGKLGGGVVPLALEQSSLTKGESLGDTVRTMAATADVIVLRHPQRAALAEAVAAVASSRRVPVLNAGNGTGEHPTQALLDVYTIHRELGGVDGKVVALVGDLKHGRTVHSLARLLAQCFRVAKIVLVAPPALAMPEDVVEFVRAHDTAVEAVEALGPAVAGLNVLYVTRVQKERFATAAEYEAVRGAYAVTPDVLRGAPRDGVVVMHPLPRNEELSTAVDGDPRAAYFRQMRYGLFARMALLLRVLGRGCPAVDAAVAAARTGAGAVPRGVAGGGAPDLSLEVLGRRAPNPLMNAAGVMCMTAADVDAVLASAAGAAVTKSCTAEPRDGNPEPRYRPLPSGSINSMGLPNEGFAYYADYARRGAAAGAGKRLFFSVSGMTRQDSVDMAQRLAPLAEAGHAVLELNLSCPNVPGKPQVGYDMEDMAAYLAGVSAVYPHPFGVKMPPYLDIAHFDAAAAVLNRFPRVAFVTCINSVGNALVIDAETESVVIRPKQGFGGLGGSLVLPTALANVNAFYRRCPEKLVFGCGGIASGEAAFLHVLAGATMLQIGTALHEEGPAIFDRVLVELGDIMARKGYTSLADFRGKVRTL